MNYLRAAHNWGHVVGRAFVYGGIALTAGAATMNRPLLHWCMNRWCHGSCEGLKIRRSIEHAERLEATGPVIIVSNHLSSIDVLLLGSYLRREFRWLAKAELFKVPISGWYLSLAGHVKVHRGELARRQNRSIKEQIHQVVGEGVDVLFFPEGTRSRDGRLKAFKMGAFLAAVREDIPILPLVVRGTDQIMEAGANDLTVRPDRACSVTVMEPITAHLGAEGDVAERASALLRHTQQIYIDALGPELVSPEAISMAEGEGTIAFGAQHADTSVAS